MHADEGSPPPIPGDPQGSAPRVVAVASSREHAFSKDTCPVIRLVEGRGVEGDAHAGTTVQHLSRARRDPTQPNLRQVHLMAAELFGEVADGGHRVLPGELGENVTTAGVDLLSLPTGTVLVLGDTAEIALTGLRNPCSQIDAFQPGLLRQVLGRDDTGEVVRRAGVMAVVRRAGEVRPGDVVTVVLPTGPHHPLERV